MSAEFSRVAALAARVGAAKDARVLLGIGDDAAVLAPLSGGVVLTVDTAIEGVHFRRAWAPLRTLARRAVMAALSDLAAMGAIPRAILVALALPANIDDAEFLAIVDGMADGARDGHAPLVGGNLSSSSELSITTTAVGELETRVLTRTGARAGDSVYVTGVLGAAALGLACLSQGRGDEAAGAPFVERWRVPEARLGQGRALVLAGATACIDVSDGLVQDLGHVCAASGVAAELSVERLPMLPRQREHARAMGLDAEVLALTGGEDYELVFTGPASPALDGIGTKIGAVLSGPIGEVRVVDGAGRQVSLGAVGFEHFAR